MKIKITSLFLISSFLNCTSSSDGTSPNSTKTIGQIAPENSTGSKGDVTLKLASESTGGLGLNLTQDIGNGINITATNLNLTAFKLKTTTDQTTEELDLIKSETNDELANTEEIEKEIENSATASLTQKKNMKTEKKDKIEHLSKNKEKYKNKEEEALLKEKKSDFSMKFMGPYVYDALNGTLDTTLDPVSIIDGRYKRIEFKLRRNFSVSKEDPLFGNVFYIRGTYTKDDKTYQFEVDYHVAINFILKVTEGSFDVSPGKNNTLAIVFDLTKWFDGVDLSTATIEEDVIYINHKTNKDIFRKIHKNIKKAVKFGKDENLDGILSDDEKSGEGVSETNDEVLLD